LNLNAPLWAGLIEVESLIAQSDLARGEKSFVNVVVSRTTKQSARQAIEHTLRELDFHSVKFHELWQISQALSELSDKKELSRLIEETIETGRPAVGTFHSWDGQG